ncbi:MAG: NapC/NirT family cytochrome c [Verrucomicrobiota bacterium]|nr:NapC/NirT family cytochrome c [Verrucomicrobiota bacterium]
MKKSTESSRFFYFKNWISLAGAVVAMGSLFSFLLLFAIDSSTGGSNPYLGILTYLTSPAFLILGLGMMLAGWLTHRRQIRNSSSGESSLTFSLDLSNASHRNKLMAFTAGTFLFLILSAFGSYKTYHFTESVTFCGEACHEVMEPEYTTHKLGSHSRISCAECHIGSGATWYVKSKISGLYQVYSVAFNKYSRPIATPIHNLRPAQETCEHCHWPQKFTGNLDRTYAHYLTDDENTPAIVRLSLKVGGSDPRKGPVGGIHWHMNVANKIEYIATDERRQVIPFVRVTNQAGEVTEYSTKAFKGPVNPADLRVMDCMDCHNRPAHIYQAPNDSVDNAIYLGHIDRELKGVKLLSVALLTGKYNTKDEAMAAIAQGIEKAYPGDNRVADTVRELQAIYQSNFFPLMKVSWASYPSNIGHKDWPGCFRCHDNEHKTADGKKSVDNTNCNACHTILAQGKDAETLGTLHPDGLIFDHPGGDTFGSLCSECHKGGNME